MTTDTGAPLRMAEVTLNSQGSYTRTTATDDDGRYLFPSIPPGRYTASCRKPPFVNARYGDESLHSPGLEIAVAAGQRLTSVDFQLRRGGVLTGRVIDQHGDAVVRASVALLSATSDVNRPSSMLLADAWGISDDRGEFRAYGITPGRYLVQVRRDEVAVNSNGADTRLFYAPTYYPGVADLAAAMEVEIAEAAEVRLAPIAMTSIPAVEIVGHVARSDGTPAASGMVSLQQMIGGRPATPIYGPSSTIVEPDGVFVLDGVPPGTSLLPQDPGRWRDLPWPTPPMSPWHGLPTTRRVALLDSSRRFEVGNLQPGTLPGRRRHDRPGRLRVAGPAGGWRLHMA